jgi:hypothetical protein
VQLWDAATGASRGMLHTSKLDWQFPQVKSCFSLNHSLHLIRSAHELQLSCALGAGRHGARRAAGQAAGGGRHGQHQQGAGGTYIIQRMRHGRGFGWETLTAAVSRRPPISLYTMAPPVPAYRGLHDGVWDLSIVQGPFSVAPCQPLSVTIRNIFHRFTSPWGKPRSQTGLIRHPLNPSSRVHSPLDVRCGVEWTRCLRARQQLCVGESVRVTAHRAALHRCAGERALIC